MKFYFLDSYRCTYDDKLLKTLVQKEYEANYMRNVVLSKETLNLLKEKVDKGDVLSALSTGSQKADYKTVIAVFYDYSFLFSDSKLRSYSASTSR